MATTPDEPTPPPTPAQRVRAVIAAPTSEKQRPITLLAISAGLVALAPLPFNVIGVALMVQVTADSVRKR